MKTGKKHSNKSIQEEKPFCPLSRNINHQFLALKNSYETLATDREANLFLDRSTKNLQLYRTNEEGL